MRATFLLRLVGLLALLAAGSALFVYGASLAAGQTAQALAAGLAVLTVAALQPAVLAVETALAFHAARGEATARVPLGTWVRAWVAEVPVSLCAFA